MAVGHQRTNGGDVLPFHPRRGGGGMNALAARLASNHRDASLAPAAEVAKEDAGMRTVREAFEQFQVRPEWSLWSDRGFTWWPHRLAQRIWADEPVEEDGLVLARVNAQTDLWAMSDREWEAFGEVLAETSRFATMSGYLHDEGVVRLHSSVWVHDENQPWISQVFRLAAVVQAFKAEAQAEGAAKAGLRPRWTNHPSSGRRLHRDDILAGVGAIRARGHSHSRRINEEVDRIGELLLGQGLPTNWDETNLVTQLPLGATSGVEAGTETSNLLTISTGQVHPQLGVGLLMRLQLKSRPALEGHALRPLDLNRLEWERGCRAHLLGSWCSDPSGGPPVFVSFVPNVLFRPNLLLNLVMSLGVRSSWAVGAVLGDRTALGD